MVFDDGQSKILNYMTAGKIRAKPRVSKILLTISCNATITQVHHSSHNVGTPIRVKSVDGVLLLSSFCLGGLMVT